MKALVIADPHIPVPPRMYGGTERIAARTCEALTSLGHSVHLLAGKNSRNYGGGLTTHRAPSRHLTSRAWRKFLFQLTTAHLGSSSDFVINHGRHDYLEAVLRLSVPLAIWFHNPIVQSDLDFVLARRSSGIRFVGISTSQVRGLQPQDQIEVIYNCIDTEQHPYSGRPEAPPYLLFLGRLTANKGVHTAIEVASRAGIHLVIAGNVPDEPGAREYFETRVRPHLGPKCQWIGPYDDARKVQLLRGATSLLFPVQWPEPFGLVMIESLACGTPVVALKYGSAPEVIRDGITGFLCDTPAEMVSAIAQLGEIDRRACRREAEERFSAAVFRQRLESLCHSLTRSGALSR